MGGPKECHRHLFLFQKQKSCMVDYFHLKHGATLFLLLAPLSPPWNRQRVSMNTNQTTHKNAEEKRWQPLDTKVLLFAIY